MTTVILAEKPDQAKKYAKALGQARWDNDCWRVTNPTYGELVIVSSVGHIIWQKEEMK
ncbi:hypothetical protein V9Z56_10000 [Streptococcus suis]|uniref:hypothetical protein n=1 Tax=Streptococcus suis TaxID=1307 RepID=UPI00211BECCC|nr:hypothetical protein [Streptococcus suis]UUM59094.1 hypothetical protein NQZ90_06335 [Streptococcus suis]HEL1546110.1 hypothetical protein [Streptococcus suis]HEL1551309.1 hypothetical protein [Streptococcus suis]HEL1552627.1 hypothetical protein [Streptococcus suis]HEL2327705.1 hypothetical protein [Streptococcus suis]